jgi:hypothetical protein
MARPPSIWYAVSLVFIALIFICSGFYRQCRKSERVISTPSEVSSEVVIPGLHPDLVAANKC